jgi:hypothetical protein
MVSRYQQHNQIAMQLLYAAYKAGDNELAVKINKSLRKDMEQQASYYGGLSDNKRDALSSEEERNANLLRGLMGMEQQFKNKPAAVETSTISTLPVTSGDSNKKP